MPEFFPQTFNSYEKNSVITHVHITPVQSLKAVKIITSLHRHKKREVGFVSNYKIV